MAEIKKRVELLFLDRTKMTLLFFTALFVIFVVGIVLYLDAVLSQYDKDNINK